MTTRCRRAWRSTCSCRSPMRSSAPQRRPQRSDPAGCRQPRSPTGPRPSASPGRPGPDSGAPGAAGPPEPGRSLRWGGRDPPTREGPVSQPAASQDAAETPAPSPFHRLADFVALPRIGGLALSRDGQRLVVSVQTLDPEKKKWQSALWEVDPDGRRPAHRLTRSAPGEASPAWAPDGSLPVTSARPDPQAPADKNGEPKPALWALPPGGGEARLVLTRSGGVSGFAVAADSGDLAVVASPMPGATDAEPDETRRKERKDAGVTAVLHEV